MKAKTKQIEDICEKLKNKGVKSDQVEIFINRNSGIRFEVKDPYAAQCLNEVFEDFNGENK
jgi:hypothetical protein